MMLRLSTNLLRSFSSARTLRACACATSSPPSTEEETNNEKQKYKDEKDLKHLLDNNKTWVEIQKKKDPTFFDKLGAGQSPDYLYIGCSDSRVPANEILGLDAGEVFVHRNVGNENLFFFFFFPDIIYSTFVISSFFFVILLLL